MMSRYRDSFANRVLAPEGELLSFASPRQLLHALLYLLHPCSRKESSQRKGDPITADVLRSSHLCPVGYLSGDGKRGFLPLCRRAASMPHPLCPWVLRAVPDKYCGARRGKREKSTLLRNVSSYFSGKFSVSPLKMVTFFIYAFGS